MVVDTGGAGTILAGKVELSELAGEGGLATAWRGLLRGADGLARPVAAVHRGLATEPSRRVSG